MSSAVFTEQFLISRYNAPTKIQFSTFCRSKKKKKQVHFVVHRIKNTQKFDLIHNDRLLGCNSTMLTRFTQSNNMLKRSEIR